MNMLKITLLASTALGLSLATAHANDNEAYLLQQGDFNAALIQQAAGPGGNRVGISPAAPILQDGNYNSFSELQATGGGFSNGDNVIDALTQDGDYNKFTSYYSNSAGSNLISDADQIGDKNVASITRNASIGGTVGTLLQQGDQNVLTITQNGTGNTVDSVKMIGSNNGFGTVNANNIGTRISQSGTNNMVQQAHLEGSNNNPSLFAPAGPFYDNVQRIIQTGTDNGQIVSIADTQGSGGNYIRVSQAGVANNFDLSQGLNSASTGNGTSLTQTGDNNMATGTQGGDFNTIVITQLGDTNGVSALQNGDTNSATVNITGDLNGDTTPFSSGVALAAGLNSGELIQTGSFNVASLDVTGNSNAFAMSQLGSSNTSNGIQSGDSNQAAVKQTTSSNTTGFNQSGNNNNAAIYQ